MPIHHIDVNPIGSCLFNAIDFFGEPSKVGREDTGSEATRKWQDASLSTGPIETEGACIIGLPLKIDDPTWQLATENELGW